MDSFAEVIEIKKGYGRVLGIFGARHMGNAGMWASMPPPWNTTPKSVRPWIRRAGRRRLS